MDPRGRPDPRGVDVLLLCVGVGGLMLCIVLVFLGMRAVMDIGGACADGGPYVSAHSCPDGATPALMLGLFGGVGFAMLGGVYGAKVGGYAWVPLLAWTGLFATLGWNFLDYGLFNPPEGEGIVWGWLIPGVLFQIMAWAPVVLGIVALRDTSGAATGRPEAVGANVLRDPGRRTAATGKTYEPGFDRPPAVPESHRVEVAGATGHETRARHDELEGIDGAMGALVVDAAADAPVDPDRRDGDGPFPEGTQALLDRLERLADMRDRGLLTPDDYETAKDAVMHELEART